MSVDEPQKLHKKDVHASTHLPILPDKKATLMLSINSILGHTGEQVPQ